VRDPSEHLALPALFHKHGVEIKIGQEVSGWDLEELQSVDSMRKLVFDVTKVNYVQKRPFIFINSKADLLPLSVHCGAILAQKVHQIAISKLILFVCTQVD
jgi:hypothetical protein